MPPEPNDPLDVLLRENDAYVDDGGFTSRVMTALPRRRRFPLRPAILLGATVLGLALLVWLVPSLTEGLVVRVSEGLIINLDLQLLSTVGVLLAAALLLGWGLFSVVRSED